MRVFPLLAAVGTLWLGAEARAQAQAPVAAPTQIGGRIIGRVTDTAGGAPIAGAQIEIVNSAARVTSAADGRYAVRLPAGPASVRVRMIGYAPKTVEDIVVPDTGAVVQNVILSSSVVQLQELAVKEAARGSTDRAIDEQRTAANIVNAVTSEQIQKSPDSDAGQAVQRVSGVTVQDGRYVFVRGLGERYTTTSLNGARIPSPEPERKVVPLDLFPSGLLEGITTSKTFTADQPGDFSGAQVNLKTREFPLARMLSLSLSGGFNTAATGKDIVQAPSVGGEWLGFAGSERRLPTVAAEAGALQGATQADINRIVGSFRNAWSAKNGSGTMNRGFGLTVGGQSPVFGKNVGYIGSLSYSYNQEVREDETRSLLMGSSSGFVPYNASTGMTARSSVLWGGILNLSTRLGNATKLSLNNTYNRTADNEASRFAGANEDLASDLDVTRLTFVERAVRSNQLAAEHVLRERHILDWSVTSSSVTRNEPDRSDIAYRTQIDPATGASRPVDWLGGPRSATRTFSELDETSTDLGGNLRWSLSNAIDPGLLKIGAAYRMIDRDADSRAYDITNNLSNGLSAEQRLAAPETIFDGSYADAGQLSLFINANGGRYTASDRLAAGYAQLDLPLSPRLRLGGGVRLEQWSLDLESFSPQGTPSRAKRDNTDLLPALSLTYRLKDNQNLRFSASRTLSRPEYREIANVSSFEPIGGTITFGNPTLRRALIQNYDMRWEWYPRSGEVLSVGVFAKRFTDPIERVLVNLTGAAANSFVNAERADNYGVEIEARRYLDFLGETFYPFSAFVNTTLMRSTIVPGNTDISALTSADRPMVGQSEYVVNGGFTYAHPGNGPTATILYNTVGPRIFEAGVNPFPDAYEQARHMLDVSIQMPVLARTSVKLQAKNLLDAPYRIEQGGVTRLRYTAGRVLSFGLSWQP